MNLKIVFENERFAIVNKPYDLNFHSEEEAGFVVHATKMLKAEQLFPVHRLDKMTSGMVILAKSSEIAKLFGELFESRKIEKFYLAISLRKPKKKQGWIKGDMAPARRGSYKFVSSNENPAITQFVSGALRPNERFFLIKPHTGKTHQIRVALKSISSPVAGDIRYANTDEAKKEDRGYLHAYGLRFTLGEELFEFTLDPEVGERFLSTECQKALSVWAKPWEHFKK
jgi:tRNA pseudouridine32 synthase / 23S rRNA pseudouridine746 synthase